MISIHFNMNLTTVFELFNFTGVQIKVVRFVFNYFLLILWPTCFALSCSLSGPIFLYIQKSCFFLCYIIVFTKSFRYKIFVKYIPSLRKIFKTYHLAKGAFLTMSVDQMTRKMAVKLGSADLSNMAPTIVRLIIGSLYQA